MNESKKLKGLSPTKNQETNPLNYMVKQSTDFKI